MTRKAILIESSNVTEHTDLPGARIDVENWKNFLKTDLGGSWLDSEILTLSKPWSSDVENALKVDKDCYSFVAFSGHGCDGFVALNDFNQKFPITSLRPKGDRGTLIVDACRGVVNPLTFSASMKVSMANERITRSVMLEALQGHTTIMASQPDSTTIYNRMARGIGPRPYWEKAVQNASSGIVEMQACSKGEAAGENASAGGYYTSLLLQSAQVWDKNATGPATHTTKNAHDYAANNLPSQQNPEYSPSWLAFPFAVKT